MVEHFIDMLAVGGKSNSLGRVAEVIDTVLQHKNRIDELYMCLFSEDAWVRMRAADALEKICRVHPDWLIPYIDRFAHDFGASTQPSIQWHMAQIYRQVPLTESQKHTATLWLKNILSTSDVDWIVAANAMDTLAQFTKEGALPTPTMISLLKVQQKHKSSAVVKRANKLLEAFAHQKNPL